MAGADIIVFPNACPPHRLQGIPCNTTTPLPLGQPINGHLQVPGDQHDYTFTLAARTLLYFDALTDAAESTWTLSGPTGTLVNARPFMNSDGSAVTDPVFSAPPGTYSLRVTSDSGRSGPYAFRLWDLDSVQQLEPGSATEGSLDPANETDLYRFDAAAGDEFYFDFQSRGGTAAPLWRLIDPYANVVYSTAFNADQGPLTLPAAGSYTLLIEGGIADTGTNPYHFATYRLSEGNSPLTLGSLISGDIAAAGEQDRYTFTLGADALLYFDALTNDSRFNWTLTGPAGVAVSGRVFNASLDGSSSATSPALALPAGDYTLTVAANSGVTGAYGFRLSNLAQAASLTLNAATSGRLDPGNESDLYKFTAAAGERFYFDFVSQAGANAPRWRLIDPYGGVVFNAAFSGDQGPLTLAAAGHYALLLEGAIGGTGTAVYTLAVHVAPLSTENLVFGSSFRRAIDAPGETDEYTFTGAPGQRLYYDALAGTTNVSARLLAPSGATVFNVVTGTNFGPVALAEAGTYRLVVDATGDVTGPYAFRVIDVATAPLLLPDTLIDGTFNPGTTNDVFRIEGAADQRIVFAPGGDIIFGSAAGIAQATTLLVTSGGIEDGYDGIDTGLNHNLFRPGAAINVVLITDEDRDVADASLNFDNILAELVDHKALLNSVNEAILKNDAGQTVLGVEWRGNAYLADGAGGFTITTGGTFVSSDGTTKHDYVDLAWATQGAVWDLNQLRSGGLTATSFTRAFVDVKVGEILDQLDIDVIPSDPTVRFRNLTGVIDGVAGGETATFTVELTGDEKGDSFDLLFVRPGTGVVLGSLPVTVGNDYIYPVRAVDPDGDLLTYRLAAAPFGATIDGTTGRIAWEPAAQALVWFSGRQVSHKPAIMLSF